MSKLQHLAKHTKCNFHLEFNAHKSYYEKPEEYYSQMGNGHFYDEVGDIDYLKDIWTVQIYARTPVGFIAAISNDIDSLLDWAIEGAINY